MINQDFRICAKNEFLDVRKLRGLETFILSRDGVEVARVPFYEIHHIKSFRDWYVREIIPRLTPVTLTEDEQRMYDAHVIP